MHHERKLAFQAPSFFDPIRNSYVSIFCHKYIHNPTCSLLLTWHCQDKAGFKEYHTHVATSSLVKLIHKSQQRIIDFKKCLSVHLRLVDPSYQTNSDIGNPKIVYVRLRIKDIWVTKKTRIVLT